eukprot:Pompholyxophrys_punicea_v1_NODE_247_length_2544_cov_39.646846.p1 type:complete len:394 gc:universal NODE_247_length_2544_cov_39.646846:159-1340(+)
MFLVGFLLLLMKFICICCGPVNYPNARPHKIDKPWDEGGSLQVAGVKIPFSSELPPFYRTSRKDDNRTVCHSCYKKHKNALELAKMDLIVENISEVKRSKTCLVSEESLCDFIVRHFGYAFCDGKNGRPLAVAEFDESENFVGFRSLECLRTDGKSCGCSYVKKLMTKTKSNWKEGDQLSPFRPLSSLRTPKFVQEKISNLQKKVRTLECENLTLQSKLVEFSERFNKGIFVDCSEEANLSLIQKLHKVLQKKLLKPSDHLFKLILVQLTCIEIGDMRGVRWREMDEGFVHWTLTLQFYGGKMIIDLLRGRSTEGLGKNGRLPVVAENWGIILPSNSTMRSYLPYVDVTAGISDDVIQSAKNAFLESCTPNETGKITPGLIVDEMEIRAGLVY